jgi:hypothetical protein
MLMPFSYKSLDFNAQEIHPGGRKIGATTGLDVQVEDFVKVKKLIKA